jgi:hypothetical protein
VVELRRVAQRPAVELRPRVRPLARRPAQSEWLRAQRSASPRAQPMQQRGPHKTSATKQQERGASS